MVVWKIVERTASLSGQEKNFMAEKVGNSYPKQGCDQ